MKEENKTLLKSFVLVGVIVILTITVTYAYFAPNISGNETVSTIAVDGAEISLKYTDNSGDIVAENILPGWSTLKRFTVETKNTSGKPIDYNINLVITSSNFYTSTGAFGISNSYLTYKLNTCTSSTDTACTGTNISVTDSILSVNSGTKLVKTVTSTGNSTVYYGLTLSFPNKNFEQKQTGTDNKPLEFSGYITIEPTNIIFTSQFDFDSWETIASNVKSGNTSAYHVGDTKQITIGGNNYNLRIANMSTPSECSTAGFSQTACGFVVEFADIYYGTDSTLCTEGNGKCMMNTTNTNRGGWPSAPLRTYLNSKIDTNSIYNKLKSVIGDIIIDTYVVSGHGSDDKGPRTDENWESIDKLYLLSTGEVYADALTSNQKDTASFPYNGSGATTTRQLDYYAGKTPVAKTALTTSNYSGTTVNNARKKLNGTAQVWWLRAAGLSNTANFGVVGDMGHLSYDRALGRYDVAPAFRIG